MEQSPGTEIQSRFEREQAVSGPMTSATSPDRRRTSTADSRDSAAITSSTFDPDRTTATQAVIEAVASETGRDPLELPPLYDSINPDALTALDAQPRTTETDRVWKLTFEYADRLVTIDSAHRIVLE